MTLSSLAPFLLNAVAPPGSLPIPAGVQLLSRAEEMKAFSLIDSIHQALERLEMLSEKSQIVPGDFSQSGNLLRSLMRKDHECDLGDRILQIVNSDTATIEDNFKHLGTLIGRTKNDFLIHRYTSALMQEAIQKDNNAQLQRCVIAVFRHL